MARRNQIRRGLPLLLGAVILGCLGPSVARSQELLPPTAPQGTATLASHPLVIPSALPGSQAPPITMPSLRAEGGEEKRRAAVGKLYVPIPPPPAAIPIQPGPTGQPLSLAELEAMACGQNPSLRQAAADVQAARGAAIQAGACPNPSFGYQADTVGTGDTAGYQGVYYAQRISTGGKLQLARAAAEVDVCNAQVALRRAQLDVTRDVRGHYFAVLIALEKIRTHQALAEFARNLYQVQIERVQVGEAAAYEPLQLRVLAMQAQGALIQAQQEYLAAWRQLAATLSMPDLPPTQIAGNIDQPVPQVSYDALLERLLAQHTSLVSASNSLTRAQIQLRLQQITPWIPDLDTNGAIQKDATVPPFNTTVSVQIGATLPLWDRNRGNILSAEAAVARARQEYCRARDELASSLAEIFARYETNRTLVEYYRDSILPDQVRSYRGVYERYQQSPESVNLMDVVTAQQALAQALPTYLQALAEQWQATVQLAGLVQVCELSELEKARAEQVPEPRTPPPTP